MSYILYISVYALSNDLKGAILDNFKDKQYELLFETNIGEITSDEKSLFNISKKIDLYSNIGDKSNDIQNQYKIKMLENLEKIGDLEQQIKDLEGQIDDISKKVGNINNQVIDIKDKSEINKQTIQILREKIQNNKEILLKYLNYLYKKGNSLSSEFNDIDNLKSILLNSENISDIINDYYFKGLIQLTGKKLIDKHRKYISELYIKKIDLEKQELLLKSLRKNKIISIKVLNEKLEFKNDLLKSTKGKQNLYESFIEDKLELEKTIKLKAFQEKIKFEKIKDGLLEKYNCEFIDISKNSVLLRNMNETCITLNKMIYAESKLKSFNSKLNNIFSWPVNPIYGISAYFNDENYKEIFKTTHDAIDIVIEQGTPIEAPADGYVIFVEKPTSHDYSYMAIKHSDGYVTVYGHLSEILVGEFDYVTQGQIIAKSGGEYGTLGAGYVTTGPHLHFELYKDKIHVDPLNYLSLVELPYRYLNKNYIYKYLIDFKEKKGYEFTSLDENVKVFKLDGNTELERQKDLLDKYATFDFKDQQVWINEALDGNIDPTFLMCIGLAETGLGRNLKTPYNVGNIGNTDSGKVKLFSNARDGIYSIVETLNNKYLGNYNYLKDLSRYGNTTGYIYASSSYNWHNNIVKCISAIKGIYINDDYNFRIIQN